MSEIQVLAPEVVDQIAAGEVVERPSHLVKELVENSIDAGATEVEVEFDFGGRQVKVIDNGRGISKDQLALALSRHATSKISKTSDIWNLNSYGFRGEALASIASVCNLTLTSYPEDSDSAHQIRSEFGKFSKPEPCGGAKGTTLIIKDLFENVPARLKFLKSDGAEGTQIKNVLRAMAMAYPNVAFRVRTKGKLLFYWPKAESLAARVCQVLGQDQMFEGEGECEGVKARVVLATPNNTVGNARSIWLYAQNRWVQDRSLQTAVREAYRSLLMHGEFPIAVAFVECDPSEIDVNIHPTKSQVKFRQSSNAFRAINRAARGVLEQAPWLEELIPSVEGDALKASVRNYNMPKAEDSFTMKLSSPTAQSFSGGEFERTQYAKKEFTPASVSFKNPVDTPSMVEQMESLRPIESVNKETGEVSVACSGNLNVEGAKHWSRLQVLGQADNTYIVTQSAQSVIFVDQHAAHERVVYEKLMNNFEAGNIEIQNVLIPEVIELSEEMLDVLVPKFEEFKKMGLHLDQMGPSSVAVNAHPSIIKVGAFKKVLTRLANDVIEKGDSFALEMVVRDLFATMACHSVVRAGAVLSTEQMKSLLEQMDEFPLSSFCPHGRPVYVEYPFNKLEKDFGRIV